MTYQYQKPFTCSTKPPPKIDRAGSTRPAALPHDGFMLAIESVLTAQKAGLMDHKLTPIPGSEFVVRRFRTSILLNLVLPRAKGDEHRYAVYQRQADHPPEKGSSKKIGVTWGATSSAERIAELFESCGSKNCIVYVWSSKSLVSLLPIEKGKEKAAEHKMTKQYWLGRSKPQRAHPKIRSRVVGWRGGMQNYKLSLSLAMGHAESDPLEMLPVLFAAGTQEDKPFLPIVSTSTQASLEVLSSDPDELIENLQSALTGLAKPSSIGKEVIVRALTNLYTDPHACVVRLLRGLDWPTADSFGKKYMERLASYSVDGHFGEVAYTLFVPPTSLEEVYHLQVRVESSIYPISLELECVLRKIGSDDALYEKLLAALPDGTVSEKGGSLPSIAFPYGALLDAGQILNYGECAELTRRISVRRV